MRDVRHPRLAESVVLLALVLDLRVAAHFVAAEALVQELPEDVSALLHELAPRGVLDERSNAALLKIELNGKVPSM